MANAAKRMMHGRLTGRPPKAGPVVAAGAVRCRKKFLRFYPGGFRDEDYVALEREYKWKAHLRFEEELSRDKWRAAIRAGHHDVVASTIVRIESRTNLLFSFEKMALRDAVKTRDGAERFAEGLYAFCHGDAEPEHRFDTWVAAVEGLPRKQTRSHLADRHGVRVPRAAERTLFSQAERHAGGSSRVRVRLRVRFTSELGHLS
jgi:hypothetical protein